MEQIETANPNDRVVIMGIDELDPFSILRKKAEKK